MRPLPYPGLRRDYYRFCNPSSVAAAMQGHGEPWQGWLKRQLPQHLYEPHRFAMGLHRIISARQWCSPGAAPGN